MKRALTLTVTVLVMGLSLGALAYAQPVGDSANIPISCTIPAIPGLNAPLIQEESVAVRPVTPAPAPQQAAAPQAAAKQQPIMTEETNGPVVLKTVYVP